MHGRMRTHGANYNFPPACRAGDNKDITHFLQICVNFLTVAEPIKYKYVGHLV